VAFGGGLFIETFTSEEAKRLIGCGLVFSGDDNVRVASTALHDVGITDENIRNIQKVISLN